MQRAPYASLLERPRGIPYVNVQVECFSLHYFSPGNMQLGSFPCQNFSPWFPQPTAANSAESLDSIPHSDCESIQPELEEVKPEVGQLDIKSILILDGTT